MLEANWLQTIGDFFSNLINLGVEELLRLYGYYAILILTFLEGETIVIIAGIFASKGMMNPYLIALVAFLGSFTSDQIMFSLGKYKGGAIITRFPKLGKNVDKAARLLKKYDTFLILGFRFVYGVRNVTPILLGISGVSHLKFFLLNFVGAAVWAASFTAAGFFSGRAFKHLFNMAVKHLTDNAWHGVAYISILLLLIAALLWWTIFRKKKHKGQPASQRSSGYIYPRTTNQEQEHDQKLDQINSSTPSDTEQK